MRRLSPIYFFKFLIGMFKEAANWRFYWKKITKLQQSGQLAKRNLRVDSIKRLYFVKNIEPEALLYGEAEEGGVEQFEKQFVADAIRVHNDLFIADGSIELVKAETKRIQTKDYYAYLIWMGFKFRKLKFWNLIYVILYAFTFTWLMVKLIRYLIHVYPLIAEQVNHLLKIIHAA